MVGRTRAVGLVVVVATIVALAPRAALARGRPTVATDAFYVGTRIAPGAALLAGWDLDVYLSHDRAISLGPGVSVSVLGSEESAGAAQDLLVSVDVARLKVGLNEGGGSWRPYLMLGGGFSYVRLPAQVQTGVRLVSPDGGDEVTGERRFPEEDAFLFILSLGGGGDLFTDGPWALTLAALSHFRLSKMERLPEVWTELSIGIRFGL